MGAGNRRHFKRRQDAGLVAVEKIAQSVRAAECARGRRREERVLEGGIVDPHDRGREDGGLAPGLFEEAVGNQRAQRQPAGQPGEFAVTPLRMDRDPDCADARGGEEAGDIFPTIWQADGDVITTPHARLLYQVAGKPAAAHQEVGVGEAYRAIDQRQSLGLAASDGVEQFLQHALPQCASI